MKKPTKRELYNKELKLLERRFKSLTGGSKAASLDVNIKSSGRVTQKDIDYIKSFKYGKLKEATTVTDLGTGRQMSYKEFARNKQRGFSFSDVSVANFEEYLQNFHGKLGESLFGAISRLSDQYGTQTIAEALQRLEAKGISPDYRTVNYSSDFQFYLSELQATLEEMGVSQEETDEIMQEAEWESYDIEEEPF